MRAEAFIRSNSPEEALPLYRQLVDKISTVLGPDHRDTLAGFNNLALVLHSLGNISEAELLFVRSYEGKLRVLGASDPDTLDTARNLADLYFEKGNWRACIPLFQQNLAVLLERGETSDNPEYLTLQELIVQALLNAGDNIQALPHLREILHAKRRRLGDQAPETRDIMRKLVSVLRQIGNTSEADSIEQLVNPPPSTVSSIVRSFSGRSLTGPRSSIFSPPPPPPFFLPRGFLEKGATPPEPGY